MLDCIVIGSGPAAISAALTLKANGKSFVLLGKKNLSFKIEKAEKITNYPGLYSVSGEEFCSLLKQQLSKEEIEVVEAKVTGVYAMKGKFLVAAEGDKTYEGKTVILATGVESVKQIVGEEEYLGRGVSYCATCDGMLYKDKTIAIVCTSKNLEHEVEYLARLAQKVYLLPLYKGVKIAAVNVERIDKMPAKIEGSFKAERLLFKDGKQIAVDGVFLLKECISPAALVGGLQVKNGHVTVDRACKTNLAGLFAAGDCTGRPYQYAKAVGEGNVAAHSVVEFLAQME